MWGLGTKAAKLTLHTLPPHLHDKSQGRRLGLGKYTAKYKVLKTTLQLHKLLTL